jgi:hypothetical protein
MYILLVAPLMVRVGEDVLGSLRPLVLLDNETYARVVANASNIPRLHEYLAVAAGMSIGFIWTILSSEDRLSWLSLYWLLANGAMFGLLVWTIYLSIADTRLISTLLCQRLKIDIFDITPFGAVGKQALASAMVFVGGILLSLIFGADAQSVQYIEFWILYIPITSVPVLIFFLQMRPTHQVLAAEKRRLQEELKPHIHKRILRLESSLEQDNLPAQLSAEFNALTNFEQRLQNTQTWPYNTAQLRTLFFSVLIPAATMLLRLLLENLRQ